MWKHSRVSATLGTRYPIIQGAFGGGLSTVELTAAVSNNGGLGSFGAYHLSQESITSTIQRIKALTAAPFAVNLWVPLPGESELRLSQAEYEATMAHLHGYYAELGIPEPSYQSRFGMNFEDQVDALIAACPPVFSFVFGIPSPAILDRARQANILTIGAATTVDEAVALDQAGVDLIVASGFEAGGHRPSFLKSVQESLIGNFSLIPQVVDAVKKPVIAAGGISNGRAVAAAFALGAEGVQVGTAFLASDESGASEVHKAHLVQPSARQTTLTRAFSGRVARGIRNKFSDEMAAFESELPPFPIMNGLTQPLRQAAARAGKSEYLSLWAGQSAIYSQRRSAADCLNALVAEADAVFASMRD